MMKIRRTTPEEDQETLVYMQELYRINYMESSKIIITGGQDFDNYTYMSEKLNELFWESDILGRGEKKIISGMDKGADTLAIRYADEQELTKILFPANWKYHPRWGGILRQEDMLSIATHLIAFWDGKSNDTKHIIDMARQKGIPVWIFNY